MRCQNPPSKPLLSNHFSFTTTTPNGLLISVTTACFEPMVFRFFRNKSFQSYNNMSNYPIIGMLYQVTHESVTLLLTESHESTVGAARFGMHGVSFFKNG